MVPIVHTFSPKSRTLGLKAVSLLIVLLGSIDCSDSSETVLAMLAGDEQFVSEDVQVRHIEEGQIKWTAELTQARGDMQNMVAQGVKFMLAKSDGLSQGGLVAWAPHATLMFENGGAEFVEVEIQTEQGFFIRSPKARYEAKGSFLRADEPVSIRGRGLTAKGQALEIDLQKGDLILRGPVYGRWLEEK
jgi:hypothetical protein